MPFTRWGRNLALDLILFSTLLPAWAFNKFRQLLDTHCSIRWSHDQRPIASFVDKYPCDEPTFQRILALVSNPVQSLITYGALYNPRGQYPNEVRATGLVQV